VMGGRALGYLGDLGDLGDSDQRPAEGVHRDGSWFASEMVAIMNGEQSIALVNDWNDDKKIARKH
jgi:hypothetical protein